MSVVVTITINDGTNASIVEDVVCAALRENNIDFFCDIETYSDDPEIHYYELLDQVESEEMVSSYCSDDE